MSTLLSQVTYVYPTGHIVYAFLLRSHILLHPGSPATPWSTSAQIGTLLDLFPGHLYFDSTKECERVRVLLGLSMAPS